MNWLIWRQHRKQILFAGIATLAYCAVLLGLGAYTSHSYHHALIAHKNDPDYYFSLSGAVRYLPLASIVLPLLFGMFWGAPLIAKEYEEGTNKLAWTQGVSRRKWLSAKLAWMMGFAGFYGLLVSLAATYCLQTEYSKWFDQFEWVHFDVNGLMPMVYAIFAVALGAAIGAHTKRVLSALALTLGVLVALQGSMGVYIRPHYRTPLTVTTSSSYSMPAQGGTSTPLTTHTVGIPVPNNSAAWRLSVKYDDDGQTCPKGIPLSQNPTCIAHDQSITTYQPANRYWPFQWMEAGIYLGLTAALVVTGYQLVLRRDA